MKGTPPDPSIPIQFFPAPGPKTVQPGPRPLPSDVNRQAHGGDPQLPVQPVPKARAEAGIRDLAAGRGREVPPRRHRDRRRDPRRATPAASSRTSGR